MTTRKYLNLIFVIFLIALINTTYAQNKAFKKIGASYQSGNYQSALYQLNRMRTSKKTRAKKYHWMAKCYTQLQDSENAIKYYRLAIRNKSKYKGIHFEYGQVLYSANELEKARSSFNRSVKKKFKKDVSLYYMGHISYVLEEFKKAKKYYYRILKVKKASKDMKQIAHFQLGEVFLSMAEGRDDIKKKVKKYVLPEMEKALKVDPKGNTAKDIRTRIKEIKGKYGLDPNVMANGRVLPKKRYRIVIKQNIKYDNNITTSTNESSSRATQRDSYIFNTSVQARYRFSFFQRIVSTPQLKFSNKYHSERDAFDVYSNDEYSIDSDLKNTFEHTLKGKRAAFIFDFQYNYTAQAWDSTEPHTKKMYSYSKTYTLGEKIKIFDFGSSTLKLKKKRYYGYDRHINQFSANMNTVTDTFSFSQVGMLPNKHLMLFLYNYIDVTNPSNQSEDTVSHLFRVDYIISEIIPKYELSLAYSHTLLSPDQSQHATRGTTETTLNPSISISKKPSKRTRIQIGYDYTRNKSEDKDNYDYSKHSIEFEFKYTF